MIRRLCLTGALALALVATTVSTAHAATVSPDTWAPDFCTALSDWQTTITEKGDALSAELENVTDLKEGRKEIAGFLGEMVDATGEATAEIKQAGSPSSPNGAKIAALFVTGFKAISKEFAKSQDQAERLPVTTPLAFKTKGKQLGQALSASGSELSGKFSAVDKLDKGKKLEAAIKAAPECAFLT